MSNHVILPTHPTVLDPRTGEPLRALGIGKRGPIWPVMGAEDPPEPPNPTDPPAYTPPASQADLDRIITDRLRRESAKYADYDELKTAKQQYDALMASTATEQERAIAAAREEERAAARKEAIPTVVAARFAVEAAGKLDAAELDDLLEDLNFGLYATDKGLPDNEKIAARVAKRAASKSTTTSTTTTTSRNLGQGGRSPAGAKPGDGGRAMAEKRGYIKPA